jgi:hypothetical protein
MMFSYRGLRLPNRNFVQPLVPIGSAPSHSHHPEGRHETECQEVPSRGFWHSLKGQTKRGTSTGAKDQTCARRVELLDCAVAFVGAIEIARSIKRQARRVVQPGIREKLAVPDGLTFTIEYLPMLDAWETSPRTGSHAVNSRHRENAATLHSPRTHSARSLIRFGSVGLDLAE